MRVPALFGRLIVLLLTSALCLAGLELWARTQVHVTALRYVGDDGRPFTQPDASRQFRLSPGFRGEQVATEFRYRMEVNALGFRGPMPRSLDAPTVFFLGDSFAFGIGAPDGETIPAHLETLLARRSGLAVWNLGVPAYAYQQYLSAYDYYSTLARPEGVVMTTLFALGGRNADDRIGAQLFEADLRSGRNWARRDRSEGGGYRRSLRRWLKENSALTALTLTHVAPAIRRLRLNRRRASPEIDLGARYERGWQIADETIGALSKDLAQYGAWLIVVLVPSQADLASYHEESRRLERIVTQHGAVYVDGGSVLREDPSAFYWPLDGHLTPKGNLRVAEAIAETVPAPR